MVPPPTVSGAAPAQPARKRKASSMPSEVERAQPSVVATKRKLMISKNAETKNKSEAVAETLLG